MGSGLQQRLSRICKQLADYWVTNSVAWQLRAVLLTQRVRSWIGGAFVSLFAFAIAAAVLLVSEFRSTADAFQPLEAILSQLGATYGTILALVLTLSIIPIQRAAEVWSSSIVRLYRRDPSTYVTFVALGVCCAASFLLAVRGLAALPVSMVLAFSLSVLGINLDLLRWYHGHVCRLLDPIHAVSLALNEAKEAIDKAKALVTRIARTQHQILSTEQQGQITVEAIEASIYSRIPGFPNSTTSWINDLAEIAIKAVARGEKLLAKTAVFAIASVAIHYLSSRRHNLILTPAPEAMFLAMTSDVGAIMDPAYEALQEVSRVAVSQGDEATAIRVTEAYRAIAHHVAHLSAPAFREGTAPLTFTPIHYAFAGVKYAQSKNLDEVAFQSAGILSKVSEEAPEDIDATDIHVPVIDGLTEIAMYLYGRRNFGLAETVNGHQFNILARSLQRKDYDFDDVLRHVLEKMELLAPLAIASEALAGRMSTVHPLGKAYGLINPNSLGYLFGKAAEALPELDPEREFLNPYHDLIGIADIIADHLRKMAESNEFGESFLLWGIDQTIKHISKVVAGIVDQPLRHDRDDVHDLVDKLLWILTFYWVSFQGKKTVSRRLADDCSDSLAFIGLLFFKRGHPEVLSGCISNIRSIFESYCDIAQTPEPFAIGDLLAHLWGIRMVMVARQNDTLTQEVDRALTTKPRGLTDEQWQGAQEAIMRRRQQLEERLAETDDRLGRRDHSDNVLRELLREPQGEPR